MRPELGRINAYSLTRKNAEDALLLNEKSKLQQQHVEIPFLFLFFKYVCVFVKTMSTKTIVTIYAKTNFCWWNYDLFPVFACLCSLQ